MARELTVSEDAAEVAAADWAALVEVREIARVDAPTSTVPVTDARPSAVHRSTKELSRGLAVSVHALHVCQN